MDVYDPDRHAVLKNEQAGYPTVVHYRQRLSSECIRHSGSGRLGHHLGNRPAQESIVQMAPEVAVGHNPDERPFRADDTDTTKALRRNGDNRLLHAPVGADPRHRVTAAHQIPDTPQPLSQTSTAETQAGKEWAKTV